MVNRSNDENARYFKNIISCIVRLSAFYKLNLKMGRWFVNKINTNKSNKILNI